MTVEVYWISGSAPAWRVLLVLETKGIEYRSHILQTSKKEQKQEWFLRLNPRGQIPLLKHGDTTVTESFAIMHYLEKQFPRVPLLGNTPAQTGLIEQTMHEVIEYIDKRVTGFVQPVFRNKIDQVQDSLNDIAVSIQYELKIVESKLGATGWLAGEFSAADIVLVPTIQRLRRAINKQSELAEQIGLGKLPTDYPNLNTWNQIIETSSAFDATFPPHWRD